MLAKVMDPLDYIAGYETIISLSSEKDIAIVRTSITAARWICLQGQGQILPVKVKVDLDYIVGYETINSPSSDRDVVVIRTRITAAR